MSSREDDQGPTEELSKKEAQLAEREARLAEETARLAEDAERLAALKTELEAREREVAQGEKRNAAREGELDKRHREVATRAGEVENRARAVTEREIAADAEFAAKNGKALAELDRTHAALRERLVAMHTQIETDRVRGLEELAREIAAERKKRLASLEAELTGIQERAEREGRELRERERARVDRERRDHDAAIAAERKLCDEEKAAARKQAEEARAEQDTKEKALRREWSRVELLGQDVTGRLAALETLVEERSRHRVSALERTIAELRADLERGMSERAALERSIDGYEEIMQRFEGSPEELVRRLDDARRTIAGLEDELRARPSAEDKARLVALQAEQRAWAAERERLTSEVTSLRAESTRWNVSVAELEGQKDQRQLAERRLALLKAEVEKYAKDFERMQNLHAPPEEHEKRVRPIETPWSADLGRAPRDAALTEMLWLKGITDACAAAGLRFPERLVHAFHTSLKAAEISPLTVLAGVSGTGKSELPRLYARFGGFAFLSLAVQPNWDSPQSLFGFFNSVDNRFNATTLLRAMVQSQRDPGDEHHGFADRLLLVLLDEMNLAHVEQYFSDMLSRLEQRRGETRDVTLDIDLGAGVPAYPLRLGRNVLWVGTMNEDETTKTLSDKVVDRSNLLYFPRPRKLHSRPEVTLGPEAELLPRKTWESWIEQGSPFASADVDPFREALERINEHLEHVGRALGHRVWQSVEHYMANHPQVIDARAGKDREAAQRAMRLAFEDQVVLKVMPKLRGIETSGEAKRRCLDPIRKQLADANLQLEDDFEIACKVGGGAFVWNSARYMEDGK